MLMKEEQLELFPNKIPICNFCKSDKVKNEAWVTWNKEKQEWEIDSVSELKETQWCDTCVDTTKLTWINTI